MTNTDMFASNIAQAFDWTQTILEANAQGFAEFQERAKKGGISKSELLEEKKVYEEREKELLDLIKRHRDPGELFLAYIVNWSLLHATNILLLRADKKPVRTDFLTFFQNQLSHEITTRINKIELGWAEEDERKKREDENHAAALEQEEEAQRAAKRAEAERAYGEAFPLVDGLHQAVLNGERVRQDVFESGQNAAQKWASKYEESLRQREKDLEERMNLIQQQEKENRDHQLAQRSLSTWDNTRSFVDALVGTGKHTLGCLLLWIVVVVVVLGALSLSIHHP